MAERRSDAAGRQDRRENRRENGVTFEPGWPGRVWRLTSANRERSLSGDNRMLQKPPNCAKRLKKALFVRQLLMRWPYKGGTE